jgi:hypothetical protein
MKKLVCLFLLVGWLAACSSGGTTESATAVSQPPAAPPTSQATAVTVANDTEEETADTADTPSDSGGARPIVIAQTAAEAAQIRDTDWTKGAAESVTDPLISIIEYGDFQ